MDERRQGADERALERARIIRGRVAAGESQAAVAKECELPSGYVSQIVDEQILPEHLQHPPASGLEMRDRIIGAEELCCRKNELLSIQNRHVDWLNQEVEIPKAHAKGKRGRTIPFANNTRLKEIFERRRFLGMTRLSSGNGTPEPG